MESACNNSQARNIFNDYQKSIQSAPYKRDVGEPLHRPISSIDRLGCTCKDITCSTKLLCTCCYRTGAQSQDLIRMAKCIEVSMDFIALDSCWLTRNNCLHNKWPEPLF